MNWISKWINRTSLLLRKTKFDFVHFFIFYFQFTFKCICMTKRDFFFAALPFQRGRFFFLLYLQCFSFPFEKRKKTSLQTQKQFQMQLSNFSTLFDKFNNFMSFVRSTFGSAFNCFGDIDEMMVGVNGVEECIENGKR